MKRKPIPVHRAAVLWPGSDELVIEDVELDDPREDEVVVRMVACGICHTDMVLRGASLTARPVVLGHEGAGVVERVGAGGSDFRPGDRVALSYASCGRCPSCRRSAFAYCHQFIPLNFTGARADGTTSIRKGEQRIGSHIFGQSSFATHVVCNARNLVRLDDSTPLEMAAPFSCGFQAGAGAVLNSLAVRPQSSVLVLGAGAVGLAAVMAARHIAGAATAIAADINDSRLKIASSVGATHTLQVSDERFEEQLRAVMPDGADYIIDTTGRIPMVERSIELLAVQGTLGLLASYPLQVKCSFEISRFMTSGRTIQGIMGGGADPRQFIPQLLDYHKQGLFPVDRLIRYYDFADINRAIEDAERGDAIKAVIRMPPSG